MSRFFFTQIQNVEMIVKGGRPMGGAVVATQVWMKSLHELGHEVLLAKYEDDKRSILEECSWVQTIPTYKANHGIPIFRWPFYRLPKFFKAIKISKGDYLFDSIPSWSSFFTGLFCDFLKIKQIIRVANDNMLDERIKLTHSLFERVLIDFAFRNAFAILAQNEFQYRVLRNKFPSKNILKVSNPFILNKKYLLTKTKFNGPIVWVANFRNQKNMILLYKIARLMNKQEFKIAGKPAKSIGNETFEAIELLKNLSNIEFMGEIDREEILELFSKGKFLLNTSHYEGFSNTFLEAMGTGTPILTTPKVNPDDIIDQYNLGFLYDNEEDLLSKMAEISEQDYFLFSTNCLSYLTSNHDHIALGNKLIDFLEKK